MLRKLNKVDLVALIAALASLIFAEILWFQGEEMASLFVGLWVPSILGFACYLKLVKIHNDG